MHRDDWIAVCVIAFIAIGCVLGSQFATFRLFFAWPGGGTWSNTIAWLEDGAIALFFVWYFRNHVGRVLATWWHSHKDRHVAKHVDVIRDHVTSELAAFEERIRAELQAHHDKIAGIVSSNGGHDE